MNVDLDAIIAQKQKELTDLEPVYLRLKHEIQTLSEARDIAASAGVPTQDFRPTAIEATAKVAPPVAEPSAIVYTIGDAIYAILSELGQPTHVDSLCSRMSNYGLHPTKATVTAALHKDRKRRKRFVPYGNNIWGLSAWTVQEQLPISAEGEPDMFTATG